MSYWFRPKRFWKWFAFYVPASWAGWVATLVLIGLGAVFFCFASKDSSSLTDTFRRFVPLAVLLMLFFDFLCFRLGEYPSWWRKSG